MWLCPETIVQWVCTVEVFLSLTVLGLVVHACILQEGDGRPPRRKCIAFVVDMLPNTPLGVEVLPFDRGYSRETGRYFRCSPKVRYEQRVFGPRVRYHGSRSCLHMVRTSLDVKIWSEDALLSLNLLRASHQVIPPKNNEGAPIRIVAMNVMTSIEMAMFRLKIDVIGLEIEVGTSH